MKSRKSEIHSKVHAIPQLKFEEQNLTAYSGLIIFQALFQNMELKGRLSKCFSHLKGSLIFGHHVIVMFFVVHLLLGFRRIRERDYYHEDPVVLRTLGVTRLPDVSTITRSMDQMDPRSFVNVRRLSSNIVCERLTQELFARITLDFDGSVLSTSRRAEGAAVGYNKKKKGARSYYPLFCTVAQTGQFLDFRHRSGNVHDSNGAAKLMLHSFTKIREVLPHATIESRMDSAFFNEELLQKIDSDGVEFTASVPFDRFSELKAIIEGRERWITIDDKWSYFESDWKPKSWKRKFRFVFIRQKVPVQRKGALQLDLFEPRDHSYDYKVIVTNKQGSSKQVLLFHNGRGSQEGVFAAAKTDTQLDYTPTNSLNGNRIFTAAVILTHNLTRELQMQSKKRTRATTAKRATHWVFQSLSTIRNTLIHRAGRITQPQGKLTLTMNANKKVQKEFANYFSALGVAA
ncbi:MAG: IS1380 family transposase [Bdellovibrionaceae bacterium]|nr:IS1380 family transposase [Pseudobdellovibrionaceae bacterium]